MQADYEGVIVSIKDPDKKNRLQVKIMGAHADDLKKSDLPWCLTKPGLGSNSGQGGKAKFQVGQKVSVEPLDSAMTEWRIVGGSNAYKSKGGGGGDRVGYEKEATDSNDKLTDSPFPDIASGDLAKLAKTAFAFLNSNLVKKLSAGNPSLLPKTEPQDGYNIIVTPLEFLKKEDVTLSKLKKFSLLHGIKYDKSNPPPAPQVLEEVPEEDVKFSLQFDTNNPLNPMESSGNDLTAINSIGEKEYIKIENSEIAIPGGIRYDETVGFSRYQITVNILHIKKDQTYTMTVDFYIGNANNIT